MVVAHYPVLIFFHQLTDCHDTFEYRANDKLSSPMIIGGEARYSLYFGVHNLIRAGPFHLYVFKIF